MPAERGFEVSSGDGAARSVLMSRFDERDRHTHGIDIMFVDFEDAVHLDE